MIWILFWSGLAFVILAGVAIEFCREALGVAMIVCAILCLFALLCVAL